MIAYRSMKINLTYRQISETYLTYNSYYFIEFAKTYRSIRCNKKNDPFSKQLCVYRANIGQEIGDGKMEEAKEEFAFLLSVRGRVLSWWRMNDDEASLDNVHGLMVPVSPHTRYENDIKGHVTGKVRSARLS